jgi:hypothetical protein
VRRLNSKTGRKSEQQQQQQYQPAVQAAASSNSTGGSMNNRLSGIRDEQLLAPLLSHPSIGQDQQVVVVLQQTSKWLQEAAAEHLAGQLPGALHAKRWKQVKSLMHWLKKNAGLLQALQLHLPGSTSGSSHSCSKESGLTEDKCTAALDELAVVLHQAAVTG